MKVEGMLFAGVAIFFAAIDVVYWYTSHDPTGTTALALAVALGFLVGFYVFITGRRTGLRPEDRPDGEISEAAGEYGFFSPYSWWPLALGATSALCFLGLAVGWWLFIIGAAFGVVALVGWTFEYFKGPHAV